MGQVTARRAAKNGRPTARRPRLSDPSHPLAWYRLLPVLFVVVSMGALLLLSKGPVDVRESQYPLEYTSEISHAARAHQVNPYWICAVIKAESGWNPEARSSAGAVGLMQVLPETASELASWGSVDSALYPPDRLTDPAVNIEYGTAYLRYLVEHYHEMEPAIAAYNAGMGNVDQWMAGGGDIRDNIRFPETRAYLLNIVRYEKQYEEIYPGAFT